MHKTLVVDSDETSREEVSSVLKEAGFEVLTAADGPQALARVYESEPDLAIVADDLPLVNGEEFCSRLRQLCNIPIIGVGSEKRELALVRMLELGADTYMTKPPSPAQLVARVNSLLRRYKRRNIERNCRGDGAATLTPTESRLFSCLVLNEGSVVTHAQLLTEVWGGRRVGTDSVRFYIRRLRDKLGSNLVLNHRGVGYRLSGSSNR